MALYHDLYWGASIGMCIVGGARIIIFALHCGVHSTASREERRGVGR